MRPGVTSTTCVNPLGLERPGGFTKLVRWVVVVQAPRRHETTSPHGRRRLRMVDDPLAAWKRRVPEATRLSGPGPGAASAHREAGGRRRCPAVRRVPEAEDRTEDDGRKPR